MAVEDHGGVYKSVSPRDIELEYVRQGSQFPKRQMIDNYFRDTVNNVNNPGGKHNEDNMFDTEQQRRDTERGLMGNFEEKKRRFEDELEDSGDVNFSFKGQKEFARRGEAAAAGYSDEDEDNQTTGKKLNYNGAIGRGITIGGRN
jgi:hypothetical protein